MINRQNAKVAKMGREKYCFGLTKQKPIFYLLCVLGDMAVQILTPSLRASMVTIFASIVVIMAS
jgi:hypothetical protein